MLQSRKVGASLVVATVLGTALGGAPARAQCAPPELQRVTGSSGAFGRWVGIDGDFAAVAGTSGPDLAHVFRHDDGGTPGAPADDAWIHVARLNSPDGSAATGIAIQGDTVVLSKSSRVEVFVREASGWQNKDVPTAVLGSGSSLGQAVRIHGDVIVAGTNPGVEQAYVFVKPAQGWETTPTPSATLSSLDTHSGQAFGNYVAVDEDVIVVGAAQDPNPVFTGAAYVFVKPDTGWSGSLTQQAKLVPSGAPAGIFFGAGVAVDASAAGDLVLVAAIQGAAAYLFREPAGGWSGTRVEDWQLTPSIPVPPRFGENPAVSQDHALLGSGGGAEKVFFYERAGAEWTSTTESAILTPDDNAAGDNIGQANALSQGTALLGAYGDEGGAGSAYFFDLTACNLIQQQPESLVRCEGESASFLVVAAGTGSLAYQWRKNGVPLVDGGSVSGANSASLMLSSVAPIDEGSYDVVVTDSLGTQTSMAATLVVHATPVLSGPANVSVGPGGTALFTVTATAPGASFAFEWRDPGDQPLTTGGRFTIGSGASSSTLTIDPVELGDDGLYRVTVTNLDGGCTAASSATLTTDDIEITSPLPPVVNSCVGDDVVLEVSATSSGSLSFTWFKDGVAVDEDGRVTITDTPTTSRLSITGVVAADEGSYRVDVMHLGVLSSTTELVLVPDPVIALDLEHHGYCPGDAPVALALEVVAAAPVSYVWRRNGIPVVAGGNVSIQSDDTGSTLTLSDPASDDFAGYDVLVTDGCARSVSSRRGDVFLGRRRITGYAASSPRTGPTTGGTVIRLQGDGLQDGLAIGFRTALDERLAPASSVVEVPGSGGTLLDVTVPPFPPGCDCGNGLPIRTHITLDNGCGGDLVVTESVFRYQIATASVTDVNGVQDEIDASAGVPGRCIVLEMLSPKGATIYNGPLALGVAHSDLTLTSREAPGAVVVTGDSGNPPALPVIELDHAGEGVCISNLAFQQGKSGMVILGTSPVVMNCNFDDNPNAASGGGISILGDAADPCATHPTLVRCFLTLNRATASGGGISIRHASATLFDCSILDNSAPLGSGIYVEDNCEDLLIAECDIRLNDGNLFGPGSVSGGGVYWTAGAAPLQPTPLQGTLLRNTIRDNAADRKGAGLFIDKNLAPRVCQNAIAENRGLSTFSIGGGIFVEDARGGSAATVFPICGNVIAGNEAQVGGAVAILNKQQPSLKRNLVFCNSAVQRAEPEEEDPPPAFAAGIYVLDAGPIVRNNTIYRNLGVDPPQEQSGGIHGDSLGTLDPAFERNVLAMNEGWEFYSLVLPYPAVNENIAFDPLDGDLLYSESQLGSDNLLGVDPLLLQPGCSLEPDPLVDPWLHFDVEDASPPALDGDFHGAVTAHPFVLDCILPPPGAVDCNGNGIPDDVELLSEASLDTNSNGILDACELTFFADVGELPAGSGGTQSFTLDAGPPFAGKRFLILGTASGTSPGTRLGTFRLPLNPDAYYWSTLTRSAPGLVYTGVLDGLGQAVASLTPSPALPSGTELHHLFVVYEFATAGRNRTRTFRPVFASNLVRLLLD